MPTDGTDFKRRLKYHGKTYTELKNGSDLKIIAETSSAGLGRELNGDNKVKSLKPLVDAAIECSESLWIRDQRVFHKELTERLNAVVALQPENTAQVIVKDSLIRSSGELLNSGIRMEQAEFKEKLLSKCGVDLHEALVISYADDFAGAHRKIHPDQLPIFCYAWSNEAKPKLGRLMQSIYDSGKPAKELLTSGPGLSKISSDSVEDLNKPLFSQ